MADQQTRAVASMPDQGLVTDDAEIARLAQIGTIEYERQREGAAERLGLRLSVLDAVVARIRGDASANGNVPVLDTAPWLEPVDGAVLLDELTTTIRKYVVLEPGTPDATAVWILHTHAIDAFSISPRLGITSALQGSGKTTLLDVLSCLVRRPMVTVNTTAAAVFRLVDMMAPTLLIDEADTFLTNNHTLRGILNSGHRRNSANVFRAGQMFSTWASAAIAMNGRLPTTLEDRSIQIRLQRRRKDEVIAPFRLDQTKDLDRLSRMAARWAVDNLDRLTAADPDVPRVLENREADNWRPLLTIADVAGREWPKRARQIAESLSLSKRGTEQSHEVMLLEDIYAITRRSAERLPSGELAVALAQLEGRPWGEWKGGKPITKKAIASLLAPFKITPVEMRIGQQVLRGYHLEQFEDAFARYVSVAIDQSATPLQTV
jgi:putative DNA primase/helicase